MRTHRWLRPSAGSVRPSERAAVIVELAIVLPIFMILITAMFDIGLAFNSSRKVESVARDAARIGASANEDRLADYEILRTVKAVYDATDDEVLGVTIYRSATGTEGALPAGCDLGDAGVAGTCNTYTAANLAGLDPAAFTAAACSGDPDELWCPVGRGDDYDNGDFLGVRVWVDHEALLGFWFDDQSFSRNAVFQLDQEDELPLSAGACYATLYSDFGALGDSRGFGTGDVNIAGLLNNTASSITVEGGGCVAYVTSSWDGQGECRTYTEGTSDMGDFNDRASYIWVGFPPTPTCGGVRTADCTATFHSDADYAGDEVTYADGGFNLVAPMDNTITSVDLDDPDGLGCVVFMSDEPFGEGDCRTLTADENDLDDITFDDEASYIWVGVPPAPTCDPCINANNIDSFVTESGNAVFDPATSTFTLTTAAANQAGTVMSDERIDLTRDFSMAFDVYLGASDAGAAGLGFVFHDDPAGSAAVGSTGGGMGMAGLINSVGVEFDTYDNSGIAGHDDIANDHTAIYDPEVASDGFHYLGSARLSPLVDLGDIENDTWRDAQLDWDADANLLSYTLDGVPMANLAIDLIADHINGDYAYFGFSAGTDSLWNLQQLRFTAVEAVLQSDPDDSCEALVVGNAPPTLTPIADQTDEVDIPIPGLIATASDAENDPLTFTGTGLPPGLTLDPDGTISGTPNSPGTYTVTITVTDPSGGTDSTSFTWTVFELDCEEQPGSVASWFHMTNTAGPNAFVGTLDQDGRVLEFPIDDISADLDWWDDGVGTNTGIVPAQGTAEVLGPDITAYSLTNLDGSTGSANMGGIDRATFLEAYFEGDYLAYGFTTAAGLTDTFIDSVSFLDVPIDAWRGDYDRSIVITPDDMATFYMLDQDSRATNGADGLPDKYAIANPGFELAGATEYEIRIYLSDADFGEAVVDDFGFQVRLGVDCTGDAQTPFDPCQPDDADCDGIPNLTDLDDDNDGILDTDEGDGLTDTDGDGTPDSQDLDSDGDGISDLVESGQDPAAVDTNGDGELDDMDNVDPANDNDADNDGLSDAVESANGPDTGYTPPDTDADGVRDDRDLDSDNDGIPDVIEAQTTTGYEPPVGSDSDGDGVDDAWDSTPGFGGDFAFVSPVDIDGDGTPDYLDTDSDSDGSLDADESGLTLSGTDADGDGIDDGVGASYSDPDGIIDDPSTDLDNELGDTSEVAYRETNDTDGDGVPDPIDIDDDNDGILDVDEGDGSTDTDGDGIPDSLDLDSDNDGLSDLVESGQDASVVDTNGDGELDDMDNADDSLNNDANANGLSDAVELAEGGAINSGVGVTPVDSDADGVDDYLDLDSDNDGIPDVVEGQPTASYTPPTGVDSDGDGIDDAWDSTVGFGGDFATDGDAVDTDNDGTEDFRDTNSDSDADDDSVESGLTLSGIDANGDGIDDAVNASYADPDGDVNDPSTDLANADGTDTSEVAYREVLDADGDGTPDEVDIDDDNDGILDVVEGGSGTGPYGEIWGWGNNGTGRIGDGTTTNRSSPVSVGTADDWVSVGTTQTSSCAVNSAGELWCWGQNLYGELGNGTTSNQNSGPVRIGSDTDWLSVSESGLYTRCAVKTDGTLWCWGYNAFYQVTSTTTANQLSPVQVGTDTDWVATAVGGYHSCGLKSDGTLWCWGYDPFGQVGNGTTAGWVATPTQASGSVDWVSVTAGTLHTCGVRSDGTAWCWGYNANGQLGLGSVTSQSGPTQVGGETSWVELSAGDAHSCGVRDDGTAWCWGAGGSGRLGDGTTTQRTSPVQVGSGTEWRHVNASNAHSCGVQSDGTAWCWGNNGSGRLGDGTTTNRTSPVQSGSGSDWARISSTNTHNLAIEGDPSGGRAYSVTPRTADEGLWGWGNNATGRIGDGTTQDRSSPIQVSDADDWVSVGTTQTSSCAVNSAGELWCWGQNLYGELGNGTTSNQNSGPVQIGSDTDWLSVSESGLYSRCAVKTDGTLWCWGYNLYYQVTSTTTANQLSPVQVGTDTDWVATAVGGYHSCGLKSDGTLWCWGYNLYGQVGNGSIAVWASAPTQAGSGSDWTSVTAGTLHTCGRESDGTASCWGYNLNGQLGVGSITTQTSPTQVGVETTWVELSAGDAHSCGVRDDGTAWCWGAGGSGRLGDGTTTQRTSPVQVGVGTAWTQVVASNAHSCGVQSDGTAWCWGNNGSGRLGDGTYTNSSTPVRSGSGTDWERISSANTHSLALVAAGADGVVGGAVGQAAAAEDEDTDGDGIVNRLDLDSDNDGISDLVESGQDASLVDTNGDGELDDMDNAVDADNNDANGNGLSDAVELAEGGAANSGIGVTPVSTDDDRFQDFLELDSDADGIPDVVEGQATTPYIGFSGIDADGDGVDDAWDSAGDFGGSFYNTGVPPNTDGLGGADYVDTDADEDAFDDVVESGLTLSGDDVDSDGIDDSLNASYTDPDGDVNDPTIDLANAPGTDTSEVAYREVTDTDGDGLVNGFDIDDDNDGILDVIENGSGTGALGEIWGWGANGTGRIGDGTTTARSSPVSVGTADDWVSVGTTQTSSCAVNSAGELWCWGQNQYGELGNGTTSNQNSGPVQIGSDTDWLSVSESGLYSRCALKTDGTLWCWGYNLYYQVTGSTTANQLSPVQVGTDTDWVATAVGGYHSCGLKSDGTLWCWGYNLYGQVGNGSIATQVGAPTQAGSGSDWTSVTAGTLHTCGRESDGTASCWGYNANGQLGVGSTTTQTSPTQVGVGTTWAELSAGDSHSCGVRDDGTAWCWGAGGAGRLGDGTTTQRTSPVQVGSGTEWRHVVASNAHSCGVQSDGTAWCWGNNGSGRLGDGTTTNRTSPVQSGSDSDWARISSTNTHTLAIQGNPSWLGDAADIDTDNDGVINRLDLDSDSDGISDLIESGQDAAAVDADGTGVLDDMETLVPNDADNDGLSDAVEAALGDDTGHIPADFDDDGLVDSWDLDADADGIPDAVEWQPTIGFVEPISGDSDGDGAANVFDSVVGFGGSFSIPQNTDGLSDGADYVDIDADQDAFDDVVESGLTLSGIDADEDGIDDNLNATYDTSPSGSISDPESELANAPGTDTSEVAYREVTDTDGDGVADGYDLDDDNDGILDTVECAGGSSLAGLLSTSAAAYTAAAADEWVAITAAEYADLLAGVSGTTVFGTPEGSEKTGTLGSFGGGAMYTYGHTGNSSPADVYVYAFKRAGTDQLTGGNDLVRLSTASNGTGFDQYGTALPDGTIESQQEHWVIKDPTQLQASPVYLGLSTDDNNPIYYVADNTSGLYATGSGTTVTANNGYGWSMQGLASATVGDGSCDDPELDTDGDGVPNRIDLDSDNDGISDLAEAELDPEVFDTDGDGEIDDMDALAPNDADGDGLSDAVEAIQGADTGYLPSDVDSDGFRNPYDLDADGDGIPDAIEGQPTASYTPPVGSDSDGDGVDDAWDSSVEFGADFPQNGIPIDTDRFGDGADHVDVDADGDTILDLNESGLTLSGTDANDDGIDDALNASFTDPDGDINDPTTDLYNSPGTDLTEVAYREITDTDGDGIADGVDIDDDNDGITDIDECAGGCDTDSDGVIDSLDLDSDNDGISDLVESGQDPSAVDTNGDGELDDMDNADPADDNDADNDGLSDAIEAIFGDDTGYTPPDTDADGLTNQLDLDSDADGIPDIVEAQPTDGYGGLTGLDDDADGIDDQFDGVVDHGGDFADPVDSDGLWLDDGPDYLDEDSDADEKLDIDESGLTLLDTDANGDGIDDAVGAAYIDPDGVVNDPQLVLDNELGDTSEVAYREAVDTDGDGLPDGIDIDDDNDGVTDVIENELEQNAVEGNHFWTVFQRNYYTNYADYTQTVYLSGEPGTNVEVDGTSAVLPASGLYSQVIYKTAAPGLHNNAFEISSDAPIVVVAESYALHSAEAWVVLPTVTLGTEYTAIGYEWPAGVGTPEVAPEINVVASQDDTVAIINGQAVALDAGEGYLYTGGPDDYTGIAVTANKAIAVISGRRCLNTGDGACDIVGEQLFPDPSLSNEYYVPALAQPHTTRIVATENNTEVRVNGTLVATLNKGSFHQQSGSGLHIETSELTVVYMIALGGELPGDPVFVLLPGAGNAVTESTFSSPQPLYQNYISVMVSSDATDSVRLDGNPVPNSWTPFVDDPDVSYQVMSVAVGVHTLTADAPFVPIIYGETDYGSYGFVAGFGNARLGGSVIEEGDNAVDDIDGDGVLNSLDLDSDNDGMSDLEEGGQDASVVDTDNDGVLDDMDFADESLNNDANNNGLSNALEAIYGDGVGQTPPDTDGDFRTNYKDLDSDDDGIPDVIESQRTTGYVPASDPGADGIEDDDSDGDGVNDAWDPVVGFGALLNAPFSTDGDGVDDYLDTDSDADLVDDSIESGLTFTGTDDNFDGIDDNIGANYSDPDGAINDPTTDLANGGGDTTEVAYRENDDTDEDGVSDAVDLDNDNDGILDTIEGGLGDIDQDDDGELNYHDLDSDNDGISDLVESGADASLYDTDNDGRYDGAVDGNGIPVDANVGVTPVDTDDDGDDDYKDLDSDADGIPDAVEAQESATYVDPVHTNNIANNGVNDSGLFVPHDTDLDGVPDYVDLDSDRDEIFDADEAGAGATATIADVDGGVDPTVPSGLPNDGAEFDFRIPLDTDDDGVPDYQDSDDDNDGLTDAVECANADPFRSRLSTSLDSYLAATDGDWVAVTAAEYETLRATVYGADTFGTPNGFTKTGPLGDNFTGVWTFGHYNNPSDANVWMFGFKRAATGQTTGGDDFVRLSAADDGTGFDQYGGFLPDGLVDGEEQQWIIKGSVAEQTTPMYIGMTSNDHADVYWDAAFTAARGVAGSTTDVSADTLQTWGWSLQGLTSFSEPGGIGSGCGDSDADGVVDRLDLDSDNDGISDLIESGQDQTAFDADNDGVHDNSSVDGDGVPDDASGGATPVDTDSDNVDDYLDLDSDGDLIPDAVEARSTSTYTSATFVNNADNQGVNDNGLFIPVNSGAYLPDSEPDYLDTDTDNDTVIDSAESGITAASTDIDQDGIDDAVNASYADPDGDIDDPNTDLANEVGGTTEIAFREFEDYDDDNVPAGADVDDDNDGLLDTEEGGDTLDTDSDGSPNRSDLDSDNDGISDLIESGQDQAAFDADNDGAHDGSVAISGLPDDAAGGATPVDTDTDNVDDYLDLDSDGDLIPDAVEARSTSAYTSATFVNNADNQGVNDNGLFLPVNSETYLPDSTPDYLDTDSDNDTALDSAESGITAAGTFAGGIDDAVNASYADPDGDIDDPNTDMPNEVGGTAEVAFREFEDYDGDNVPAAADLDDDNDGLLDTEEGGNTLDTDSDGVANRNDLDSDNDGISDLLESGQDQAAFDADNDGVHDNTSVDADGVPDDASGGVSPVDTDADNVDDYLDLDSDNDLIPDAVEAQATNTYVSATSVNNANNQGVNDNGLFVPVTNEDYLPDTTPDWIDTDTDNDGYTDAEESGITAAGTSTSGIDDAVNASYADPDGDINVPTTDLPNETGGVFEVAFREVGNSDGDDIPPFFDLDDDNDGVIDTGEGGETLDTDGDGVVNRLDLDSDNDGISDLIESGQNRSTNDFNRDGIVDGAVDGDGVPTKVSGGFTPNQTDADGIADMLDLDSDDDLIPDVVEAQRTSTYDAPTFVNNASNDGVNDNGLINPVSSDAYLPDGIPDWIDTDSDNDSIDDRDESGITAANTDLDNDGIDDAVNASYADPDGDIDDPNTDLANEVGGVAEVAFREFEDDDEDDIPVFADLDDDNDGLLDTAEGSGAVDTDNDGAVDSKDLDSDNDGISDLIESGQDQAADDVDNDGFHDGAASALGIPTAAGGGVSPIDTDFDSIDDHHDLDSDGDLIPDAVEARGTLVYSPATFASNATNVGVNDNGLFVPVDTFVDGDPDYLDTDSDDDGASDQVESGLTDLALDVDSDGIDDGVNASYSNPDGDVNDPDNDLDNEFDDTTEVGFRERVDDDGDGVYSVSDLDDDNDGMLDVDEGGNTLDSDNDGVPDRRDLDSDNDGVSDFIESGQDQAADDADNDGRHDGGVDVGGVPTAASGGVPTADFDLDSVPDHTDLDSDGDLIPDVIEARTTTPFVAPTMVNNATNAGVNDDGLFIPVDTAVSGTGDFRNLDSDLDGATDQTESGLTASGADLDDDGIDDGISASYTDPAGDVDVPSFDLDNEFGDTTEVAYRERSDLDSDGVFNAVDLDRDGDGILNTDEGEVDTDSDSVPDATDLDSDNDGISDLIEAGQDQDTVDADNDGRHDGAVNAGGIPLAANSGLGQARVNTDGDGITDEKDLDADGDGIPDAIEAQLTNSYSNPTHLNNAANDGVNDNGLFIPVDYESDGTPDYLDLNSDTDVYTDAEEAGSPATPTYTNVDASINPAILLGLPDNGSEFEFRIFSVVCAAQAGSIASWFHVTNVTGPNSDTDTVAQDGRVLEFPVLDLNNDLEFWDQGGTGVNPTYIDGPGLDAVIGDGITKWDHSNKGRDNLLHLEEIDAVDLAGALTEDEYVEYGFTTEAAYDSTFIDGVSFTDHPGNPWGGDYERSVLISDDDFATYTILDQDYLATEGLDVLPDEYVISNVDHELVPGTDYKIRVYVYGNDEVVLDDFGIQVRSCS